MVAVESPGDVATEWAALADRSASDPFLHPDWCLAWRDTFAPGRLAVATARDESGLRAVAPVLLDGGTLRFAGNEHVPWVGLLADRPGSADELVAGLIRMAPTELRAGPTDLDGPLASALRRGAAAARCRLLEHEVRRSPVVDLRDVGDVSGLLDARVRKDLRRRRRRLEELGEVTLTLHGGGPDLATRLDEAFDVELRQWKGAAGTAIASSPRTAAFYSRIATSAARRGQLQLAVLRVDGRAVAVALDLVHREVLYGLKAAFDPEFARFSPGQLMTGEILADAVRRGIARYEFLGGAEPYKMRWTSEARRMGTVVVHARTPAGLATYAWRRHLRPAGRHVRDALVALRPTRGPAPTTAA